MKISDTFQLSYPAEEVARVLHSEAFHVDLEQGREGVVSTAFQPIAEQGERVEFEMHSVEYKRTKTGRIDRSTTETNVIRYTFDGAARTLRWRFGGSERFKLSGVYQYAPAGERTRVEHEITIDITLPLIGRQIAKFVAKEFQKEFPRYRRTMEKHLRPAEASK